MIAGTIGAASCATSSTGGIDGGSADASTEPADARPLADAAPPDSAPAGPGFFLHDNGGDFTGATATFDQTAVTSYGAVAPIAYYAGGLSLRAADAEVFADGTTAAWTDVTAMTLTDRRAIARDLSVAWGSATPAGLALTDGDNLTLIYTGEIYLEAGDWTFYLLADNAGFVEIAQPGSATFSRVVSANWPDEASGSFTAGIDAWHPFRMAISEATGGVQVRLQQTGPGVASRADVSRHRLRFRADDLSGLFLAGFDDAYMLGDSAVTIDDVAPAAADWADGNPTDLGLSDADFFTTRWAGQLRIDVAGDYSFRYQSDDGHRLWIDGVLELDAWDETSHDSTTDVISLDLGWHDIVIDHLEASGPAQAELTVASGPQGGGQPLAVDRLRPIVTRRERYETGVDRTDRPIPDTGTVTSTIAIDAPPGAKTAGVEVGWTFDHDYHGDLEIRLRAPDGSEVLLRDSTGGSSSGSVTERRYVADLDGATASGDWLLRVTDTTSLDTGTLRDFQLTVHHRSGNASIPLTSSYTSPVVDLGAGVLGYEMLSWGERRAAGAAITMRVRSGGSESEVMSAPWSTPLVDAGGSEVPEIPRRYFQYRIDFDSDGDGSPAVDWVRLDYVQEGAE